jgi:nardilysin
LQILPNVVQSPEDKRSFRLIRLPNGLVALLVHDERIKPEADDGGPHAREGDDESEGDEDDESNEDDEGDEGDEGDEPEQTKKAAAALAVGVGSFSDFAHMQGIAHYLEHMLFMGTEKYPDENEYLPPRPLPPAGHH